MTFEVSDYCASPSHLLRLDTNVNQRKISQLFWSFITRYKSMRIGSSNQSLIVYVQMGKRKMKKKKKDVCCLLSVTCLSIVCCHFMEFSNTKNDTKLLRQKNHLLSLKGQTRFQTRTNLRFHATILCNPAGFETFFYFCNSWFRIHMDRHWITPPYKYSYGQTPTCNWVLYITSSIEQYDDNGIGQDAHGSGENSCKPHQKAVLYINYYPTSVPNPKYKDRRESNEKALDLK